MKTLFTILLFILSLSCFGQIVDENNTSISMSLESVSSILVLSDNYIKVSNTETMIVNFDNKFIEVGPGIHRIKLDVDGTTTVILMQKSNTDLIYIADKWRIIKGGQEDINSFSDEIIYKDYVEYTVYGYLLGKY